MDFWQYDWAFPRIRMRRVRSRSIPHIWRKMDSVSSWTLRVYYDGRRWRQDLGQERTMQVKFLCFVDLEFGEALSVSIFWSVSPFWNQSFRFYPVIRLNYRCANELVLSWREGRHLWICTKKSSPLSKMVPARVTNRENIPSRVRWRSPMLRFSMSVCSW